MAQFAPDSNDKISFNGNTEYMATGKYEGTSMEMRKVSGGSGSPETIWFNNNVDVTTYLGCRHLYSYAPANGSRMLADPNYVVTGRSMTHGGNSHFEYMRINDPSDVMFFALAPGP